MIFVGLPLAAVALAWTLLCTVFALPAFILRKRWGHIVHRNWAKGLCAIYGIKLDLLFLHHLPKGGVVLAPNHQSMFDMPLLAQLPIDFKWVSKSEMRWIPLLGWGMKAMGCFFVSRSNPVADVNVLKDVEDGLRRGIPVVIFPEGTRTRDGNLLPFKKGAFRVAQNAGVPLCPIAIYGSYAIAPPWTVPIRRGYEVSLRVGSPLTSAPSEDPVLFMERARKELVRLLEEPVAS